MDDKEKMFDSEALWGNVGSAKIEKKESLQQDQRAVETNSEKDLNETREPEENFIKIEDEIIDFGYFKSRMSLLCEAFNIDNIYNYDPSSLERDLDNAMVEVENIISFVDFKLIPLFMKNKYLEKIYNCIVDIEKTRNTLVSCIIHEARKYFINSKSLREESARERRLNEVAEMHYDMFKSFNKSQFDKVIENTLKTDCKEVYYPQKLIAVMTKHLPFNTEED